MLHPDTPYAPLAPLGWPVVGKGAVDFDPSSSCMDTTCQMISHVIGACGAYLLKSLGRGSGQFDLVLMLKTF